MITFMRKLIIAIVIVFGAGLVFASLLERTAGPRATFPLSARQLTWLTDLNGLRFEMREAGSRHPAGSRDACSAVRNAVLEPPDTVHVTQICTDEQNRVDRSDAKGTWRVEGNQLCLDARPLDRDPACWDVVYRNGTLEFLNRAGTVRWFVYVESSRIANAEDLLAGLSNTAE